MSLRTVVMEKVARKILPEDKKTHSQTHTHSHSHALIKQDFVFSEQCSQW